MAERSKTFCPLPFIHSHASVNGHWKPCCNSNYHNTKKNYFEEDRYDHRSWFNSDRMNLLRKNLLNGVKDEMCQLCWNSEKIAGKSIRTRYAKNEKFTDLVSTENPKIKYLDLKLSNECNLRCRMCDYTNSNKLLEDMKMIEQNKDLVLPANLNRSPKHERLIDSNGIKQMPDELFDEIVNEILPELEVLKVTGGEPLVQKQVLELFDVCIDKGYAKNIDLNITTNATKFTTKFLERLKNFKQVKFNISCDGYGTVYDYIRYPFNWNKFVERVNSIKESNLRFSIVTVPQMYNIENISKLQKWNSLETYLNSFLHPESIYNSLKFVPKHILKKALSEIKRNNNSIVLIKHLEKLIREDYQPTVTEQKRIVESVKSLDIVRNQDFRDYLEPMTVEWLDGLFKQYA